MRLSALTFPTIAALTVAACVNPALSGTEIAGTDWHLVGLEGQSVGWTASLRFDGEAVSGKAPCNSWGATTWPRDCTTARKTCSISLPMKLIFGLAHYSNCCKFIRPPANGKKPLM